MATFDAAYEKLMGTPPPPLASKRVRDAWPVPLSELTQLSDEELPGEPLTERHRIYSLLLMAVIHYYWNGLKYGRHGSYPMSDPAAPDDPPAYDGDYLGHNIAAIAVDRNGRILDFDFNHNKLFNSSAEHAETRLVRRLYSLAQVSESWSAGGPSDALGPPGAGTANFRDLSNVTIYTSLESCAQCSGVMALAQVKEVVYLQTDPGQYFIGRILRNLTGDENGKYRSPLPIAGADIGLSYFGQLDRGYERFYNTVSGTNPFYVYPGGKTEHSKSVTSFLCTSAARALYAGAGAELRALADGSASLRFPEYRTTGPALKNLEVVGEAVNFLTYACGDGRRGTPHNL